MMQQQQEINKSQYQSSITERFSARSQLCYSMVTNEKALKEQLSIKKGQLIKNLLQSQTIYIANLKIINFMIKLTMINELRVSEENAAFMFDNIDNFITQHTGFINELVEQQQALNQRLIKVLRNHFSFFALYKQYIKKIPTIMTILNDICKKNSERVRNEFKNFQKPLQFYILLPMNHLKQYKQFIKKCIACLRLQHNIEILNQFIDLQNSYRSILENPDEINLHLDSCLMKFFPSLQSLDIVLNFQVVYNRQPCRLYMVKGMDKQNKLNAGVVVISQKCDSLMKQHLKMDLVNDVKEQFTLILAQNLRIVQFGDTINYRERIGLCNSQIFYMLQLKSANKISLFKQKFDLLEYGAVQKNYNNFYVYQSPADEYDVVLSIAGLKSIFNYNIQQVVYVIKVYDYRSSICQYIFIKLHELKSIIDHVIVTQKLNSQIQFDINFKYLTDAYDIIENLTTETCQNQENEWAKLQNYLNLLIRVPKFRKSAQYFWGKLDLFEGMWQILTAGSKYPSNKIMMNQCNCQKCNYFFSQYANIKQMDTFKIYQILDGTNNIHQQSDWDRKYVCPHFWLKIHKLLLSTLTQKTKYLQKRFSHKGFNYTQKLLYTKLQEQKIGWKLNRCFKKLSNLVRIKLGMYNILGQKYTKQICQVYSEESVGLLMKRITKQMGVKIGEDLCLYSCVGNRRIQYDEQQYVSQIIKQSSGELILGKRQYFYYSIEQELIQNEANNNKFQLVIGEIIHKVRNYQENIAPQFLKDYLLLILQIYTYFDLNQIVGKATDKFVMQFVHENNKNLVTMKLIQSLDRSLRQTKVKERKTSQFYAQAIKIFHRIGKAGCFQYKCRYLRTSIISSKIFESFETNIRINHQNITVQVYSLASVLKMSHNEYKAQIIGSLICIGRKNDTKAEQTIWIKMPNSYCLWRKIATYQKMYLQICQNDSKIYAYE